MIFILLINEQNFLMKMFEIKKYYLLYIIVRKLSLD